MNLLLFLVPVLIDGCLSVHIDWSLSFREQARTFVGTLLWGRTFGALGSEVRVVTSLSLEIEQVYGPRA